LREQNYSDKENGKAHEINAEKILIATGGRSYPSTGSDGSGYLLAEGLGHTIVPIVPALVPLKGDSSIIEKLNGLSIRNCRVSVFSEGKKIYDRFGEMEFRDNELAGAVILFISRDIVMRIKNRERISIAIDLKPSLDHKKLDKRLLREIQDEKNINCTDILKTLLPGKAIDFFLSETGINGDKKRSQLTSDERRKLRNLLKKINIDIKGSVSLSKALVTSGGVSLKEINSQTMESKLRKGLYFAGEVIDVDGKTGGFNLQAAFSTGWTAGRNMGKGGSHGAK
jgi:predicted Rossmann fold flavoprotein